MTQEVTPSESDWQAIIANLGKLPGDAPPPPANPNGHLPDWALADVPELDEDDLQPYLSPRSQYVAGISIIDVYNRYAGKGQVPTDQRGPNVVVRCPTPQHNDENPSACLEVERNVWVCYGCDANGGTYEIAAYHYGYAVPEYRHTSEFAEVVKHMADDFGYTPGDEHREIVYEEEVVENLTVAPVPEVATPEEPVATVTPIAPKLRVIEDQDDEPSSPTIFDDREPFPWWDVYDEQGFRYQYMLDTTVERIIPHEFLAAGADTALGLALGHNLFIQTSFRTYGNVYSVLIGHTGAGKSVATIPIFQILEEVLPYDMIRTDGVKHIPQVGSGEALIHQMKNEGINEETGQPGLLPLRGFLYVDELASFVARMSRRGSTLQSILTEMYGSVDRPMATYSLSTNRIECVNPYLSFMTGVQPQSMQTLMGDIDLVNGFLNRFMVYVGTKIEIPDTYDASLPHPFHLDESSVILTDILNWGNANKGCTLEWTPAAAKYYNVVFRQQSALIDSGDHPELARLNMILSKLILLCATDVLSPVIEVEHVERAERHLEYFTGGLTHIAENVGGTLVDEASKKIVEGMERLQGRGKDWLTRKQVREFVRKGRFVDQFDKVLQLLEELEIIESRKLVPKAQGRPTVQYRLKNKPA